MFNKNNFSNRIKQLRNEKNISQSQLAKEINLTKNALSDIERNRRTTTISKIYLMADFFIDYFFYFMLYFLLIAKLFCLI